MNVRKKGCFIVFEGIDGAGKTLQTQELVKKLRNMKYNTEITHEPHYESQVGNLIRKVLNKKLKVSDETLALLFAADRIEHTKNVIIPILESNSIIISDRYIYSSLAYQCGGMNTKLDINWVKEINKYAIEPDVVFFLDIPPNIGLSRLKEGQKRVVDDSFFENIEKQSKIRKKYYEIFGFESSDKNKKYEIIKLNDTKIVKIDSTLDVKKIKDIIGKIVKNILVEKNIPKNTEKFRGETNLHSYFEVRKE